MNCIYCDKICKNDNSLRNHQRLCKNNPDRQILKSNFIAYNKAVKNGKIEKNHSNQFTKAQKLGLPKPIVSEETRLKISKSSKGKKYTKEHRKKLSESMKKAVRENPESYSGSNINGRVKKILYKGVKLDGSWELLFANWCDNNNLKWSKPTAGFEYIWNGSRIYYPDFYLKDLDLYIEVKGYERERDRAKWSVLNNLVVIKLKEIRKIKDGIFTIADLIPYRIDD